MLEIFYSPSPGSAALYVDQKVEWQYAFDIHCNAFFVMFMGLYVLQVKNNFIYIIFYNF